MQRQKEQGGLNLVALWRTSSQHLLFLYAPSEFKSQWLAKQLHSLLGEKDEVTVVGWALEEGKNHTKSPAEGGTGR